MDSNIIYEVKLTIEEINIIKNGLSELPAKFSMPIILEINRQVLEQGINIESSIGAEGTE